MFIGTRRQFTGALLGTAAGVIRAAAQGSRYVVWYPCPSEPEVCFDQMNLLAEQFPRFAADLRLLIDADGRYRVVWAGDITDKKRLEKLAKTENRTLQDRGLGSAQLIQLDQIEEAQNIRCSQAFATPDEAKAAFAQIYGAIDPRLGKNLFVETIGPRQYAVVLRSLQRSQEGRATLTELEASLTPLGFEPYLAPERNRDLIFSESNFLSENEPGIEFSASERVPPFPQLEADIRAILKRTCQADDEEAACLIIDVKTNKRLVEINASLPMQCASMFKPFIAMLVFQEIEAGRMRDTPAVRLALYQMIVKSNNDCTNDFMDQLGGPARIQSMLTGTYGHIFQQTSIVQKIPKNERAYKNKVSPDDYGRFLTELDHHRLPGSLDILELMLIKKSSRLGTGPRGTTVSKKTGSTACAIGVVSTVSPPTKQGTRRPTIVIVVFQRPVPEKPYTDREYHQYAARCGNGSADVAQCLYGAYQKAYGFAPPPSRTRTVASRPGAQPKSGH